MARRRPWCKRAMTHGPIRTNVAKMRRTHSHSMRWGGRIVSLGIIAAVILFIVLGISMFLAFAGGSMDAWAWGSLGIGFAALATIPLSAFIALGLVLKKMGKNRIKKELLGNSCQLCVHCFYDLSARPRDDDTCPECGLNASRRECVRLWCKLLRSRF